MATMETMEDEWFEYSGPVALCGGGSSGGSSTTNTVDKAYNARMATLSEEQQDWAREYFSVWQDYQKPYEIAQAQANMEMLPLETSLYKNQLNSANSLLPLETDYAKNKLQTANDLLPQESNLYKNQLDAASSLLPLETDYAKNQLQAANSILPQETALYEKQLQAANQLLPQQTEAASKFLGAALNGVDVNERMALAATDTSNAWKDARAATNRANARLGVNPNSGRYQGIMGALDTNQAAQVAGAKTQARVGAEQENFNRLVQAASLNGVGQTLQSAQAVKPQSGNGSSQILQGMKTLQDNVTPQTGDATNQILQGVKALQS